MESLIKAIELFKTEGGNLGWSNPYYDVLAEEVEKHLVEETGGVLQFREMKGDGWRSVVFESDHLGPAKVGIHFEDGGVFKMLID